MPFSGYTRGSVWAGDFSDIARGSSIKNSEQAVLLLSLEPYVN